MKITKIFSEAGPKPCGKGQCPTVHVADTGDVFIQGYIPTDDEGKNLTAPKNESFVKMSRSTFETIAKQVLAA